MQKESHNHQVIVIGTSSGGLAALREFLAELPSDLTAAVFVTMHIGDQPSVLPNLLAQTSPLPVGFAVGEEPIQTGRVYIAPPDKHLLVRKELFRSFEVQRKTTRDLRLIRCLDRLPSATEAMP